MGESVECIRKRGRDAHVLGIGQLENKTVGEKKKNEKLPY